MFGPERAGSRETGERGIGSTAALFELCDRAGVGLRVPEAIEGLCCGTPWRSKGYTRGYEAMRERVLDALMEATEGGALPVVCDASSCTEGLVAMIESESDRASALRVIDAVSFVAERVLPLLEVTAPLGSIMVHPTCSSHRLGSTHGAVAIANRIAGEVEVPADWGCCGFAGDRGLLHPELTAAATAPEAATVAAGEFDAYVSSNRTCELGMTRATGKPYRHVLELLEEATRPATGSSPGPNAEALRPAGRPAVRRPQAAVREVGSDRGR